MAEQSAQPDAASSAALAPPSYSWMDGTISHLGAQGYGHAWVMRAGFVTFGALLAFAAYRRGGAMPSVR